MKKRAFYSALVAVAAAGGLAAQSLPTPPGGMPGAVPAAGLSSPASANSASVGNNAPVSAPVNAPVNASPTINAAPSSTRVSVAPAGTSLDSGTFERTTDKIFNFDKDSVDLENGTLNWKGKTFDIGNSRAVRSRFERYLAMDLRNQNFETYQRILGEIAAMLSPSNDSLSPETVRLAWSKLYDAAEYDIDNDGCIAIANNVYQTWRLKGEFERYRVNETEQNRALEASKRTKLSVERYKEMKARADTEGLNLKRAKAMREIGDGAAEVAFMAEEIASKAANLAVVTAAKEATGMKAILQFQSQILAFVLARKFQHATIASYFYRHLYKGGAQDFEVGKEQFAKFFPFSGFAPTNDILESMSTEAGNDVRESMISVRSLYDSGQRYTALMRLLEAFALGENEPSVRSFEFEKKKVLHGLYRDLSALKDMGDNHDFDGIERVLERIRQVADDFPSREIQSKVKIAKQSSNLKVMEARACAASGDIPGARAALAEAAQIWPLNPQLDKFNDEVMQMTIGTSRHSKLFAELVEKRKWRDVMESAPEFALALRDDAEQSAKLKEIVSKVSQIDMLVAQAREMSIQGNSYVAWEMLEKARAMDEGDIVVARAMSELAPKVSDYVRALDSAKEAERGGRPAEAVNFYLMAQDIYPMSQACREGIERQSGPLLRSAVPAGGR